jgi:hypothetical protein
MRQRSINGTAAVELAIAMAIAMARVAISAAAATSLHSNGDQRMLESVDECGQSEMSRLHRICGSGHSGHCCRRIGISFTA